MCIDGHQKCDIAEYRKLYLRRLEVISLTDAPSPLYKNEQPIDPFIGPQFPVKTIMQEICKSCKHLSCKILH